MGRLVRFEERIARYARVDLESSDPIWISVAQTGVLIKRSRLGFFGPTIYSEMRLSQVAAHCRHLDTLVVRSSHPVSDPVLAPFTAAALNSRTLNAFHALLAAPPLLESSYLSEHHFQILQRFVNQHGTFVEQSANWAFGFSEGLLPLPSHTVGEMLLIYAAALLAREELTPQVQFAIRFAYGQLALALPVMDGDEAMAISDRLIRADMSVERDPAWDRVQGRSSTLLVCQTDRELEFDHRLAETRVMNVS